MLGNHRSLVAFSALIAGAWFCACASAVLAAPCLLVTVTGAGGGPPNYGGLAGPGTLVRYGDDSNDCNAVRLQFDAGRATSVRLTQVGVTPGQLNAIFFTHMHSDHVDGFADIMQLRWHYNPKGPKLDVVCSADAPSPAGFTLSCSKLAAHIADAYLHSGEIAQRLSEDKSRPPEGPAALTRVVTFDAKNDPQIVWSSGDVKVSAIRSTHIPGHASYRVDTPAGSVVIGGAAKHLVLTHLIPPVGAERQGFYKVPGGALREADYRKAAESGGFTGNIVVGIDLATIRLPAK